MKGHTWALKLIINYCLYVASLSRSEVEGNVNISLSQLEMWSLVLVYIT